MASGFHLMCTKIAMNITFGCARDSDYYNISDGPYCYGVEERGGCGGN